MYARNSATPRPITVGPVVLIADGTVQTTGVSAKIRKDGGAWTLFAQGPFDEPFPRRKVARDNRLSHPFLHDIAQGLRGFSNFQKGGFWFGHGVEVSNRAWFSQDMIDILSDGIP